MMVRYKRALEAPSRNLFVINLPSSKKNEKKNLLAVFLYDDYF